MLKIFEPEQVTGEYTVDEKRKRAFIALAQDVRDLVKGKGKVECDDPEIPYTIHAVTITWDDDIHDLEAKRISDVLQNADYLTFSKGNETWMLMVSFITPI